MRDVDFDYTTKAVAKSTSLYINNILDISLSEKLYIDSEGEVSINYLSKPNTSFNNLVEQSLKYNIAPPSVREATPILMFSECESQQFFEECVVKNRNLIRHKQIEFAGNKKLQTKLYWLIKYHNDICGSHDLGKEYQISTKYRYIHPTLRTKQSKPFRR